MNVHISVVLLFIATDSPEMVLPLGIQIHEPASARVCTLDFHRVLQPWQHCLS